MSDVSADVLAEGWVVPEDIAALSVFSFARCRQIPCFLSFARVAACGLRWSF